jgi:hypothetical protein
MNGNLRGLLSHVPLVVCVSSKLAAKLKTINLEGTKCITEIRGRLFF